MGESLLRPLDAQEVLEADIYTSRMPDNAQIDKVLDYAIKTSPVDLKKLSPEGRVLIDDFRDIIETLRMMVVEKNADEVFQNAVYTSYAGDPSRAKQDGVAPITKDEAKKDVDQGMFPSSFTASQHDSSIS